MSLVRKRQLIRRIFSAITVRGGDAMHLNVNPRRFQGIKVMKNNLLIMKALIQMKSIMVNGIWIMVFKSHDR